MTSEEANNFSGGLRPHAVDHNDADRLWQISKNITGLDFE